MYSAIFLTLDNLLLHFVLYKLNNTDETIQSNVDLGEVLLSNDTLIQQYLCHLNRCVHFPPLCCTGLW